MTDHDDFPAMKPDTLAALHVAHADVRPATPGMTARAILAGFEPYAPEAMVHFARRHLDLETEVARLRADPGARPRWSGISDFPGAYVVWAEGEDQYTAATATMSSDADCWNVSPVAGVTVTLPGLLPESAAAAAALALRDIYRNAAAEHAQLLAEAAESQIRRYDERRAAAADAVR